MSTRLMKRSDLNAPARTLANPLNGLIHRGCVKGGQRRPHQDTANGRDFSIEIQSVSHRFEEGTLEVLRAVDLSIREGEFVAIVGPSGCGKTTILNLIAGLIPVTEGTIEVGGSPPRAGAASVVYMFARDALLAWKTARQNAEFGARVRDVPKRERRRRALDLLRRVGLEGFEDKYPNRLSHGMRQRVALARTFCVDAPILLMDEPFGALDAQTKLQLEDVLLELWSDSNRTVVFVTHDLSEAIALADRVVVMSGRPGRIKSIVEIPLERPRSVTRLQADSKYHQLYSEIWSNIEASYDLVPQGVA